MKKFYYFLAGITMVLVTIFACEKASIEVEEIQDLQEIELSTKSVNELSSKGDKVDVCHYDAYLDEYFSINISENALPAHRAHGDKYTYSPEGNYTILRDNGAVLNILINPDGTITGSGYTSKGPSDPQTYSGTVTVNDDHTILLVVPQSPQGGTHYIEGIVSECGGIIEFTNDYTLIE